jgi:hypothetical protein
MYNIKSLLTEELILNDKKNQLSEHTLMMISDPMYVKHVLGIDVPLNENYSLALRKKIIEEALSMQNILASANKFIGSAVEKGKEKVEQAIDAVKSTKDLAILFKDVILSPENMSRANIALNQVCNKLKLEIDKVIMFLEEKLGVSIKGLTDKIANMLTHLKNVFNNIISTDGWLGFLTKLGLCILVTYIQKNIFDKIMSMGLEFLKFGQGLFEGISNLLNMFKNFKETIVKSIDVSGIISWITSIGSETVIAKLNMAFGIMSAVSAVTTPVLKSMYWQEKLQKKR